MTNRPGFAGFPAIYAHLFYRMTETAKEHGYTLALHGSLGFDLDVVAIPWTESAVASEVLVAAFISVLSAYHGVEDGKPTQKPHGRLSWTLRLGGHAHVDLSVMPRVVNSIKLTPITLANSPLADLTGDIQEDVLAILLSADGDD